MKNAALLPVLAATVLFAQSAPPARTGSGSVPAGPPATGAGSTSQNPPAAPPKAAEPARTDPGRPLPPISERVEVSVTNVDVVVTDSKGNRVNGLTRDDFEVFQDNVPQTITNFYAVAGGKLREIYAQLSRRQARSHFIQLGGIGKLRGRLLLFGRCAKCGGKKKYKEEESSHGHLDRDPASVGARRGPSILNVWDSGS